ncbi:MAG: glycosyltransferase family 39 protein [Blastocatellia bacterium]|nr:glycosyltransferase family 39 protein [Blastocatellia bacterium]
MSALVVLCAVVFFYGLGRLPFLGPDEPRYAQVAREMLATGDWVTPRLGGIVWFEKPALTYWLSGIGYALFGENEFGARAGIAFVACVGVLLLYGFGRRRGGAGIGFGMAAVLATCGIWPGFARGATFDLPLSVAMELALLAFFLWDEERERPRGDRWFYLFAFGLGLGLLAKGLVGLVLPAAIIGPYLLLTGGWRRLPRLRLLLLGGVVLLGTAAVWYGPVIAINGWAFIREFFIGHHFERYLTNKYRHPQPVYFFPVVVLAGSFPWTVHLIAELARSLRLGRTLIADRLRLFALLWLLVPIVFFSFSGSKLPGYILPVFPAVALLIGGGLRTMRSWVGLTTGALIALTGIAALLVGSRELGVSGPEVRTVATLIIVTALVYLGTLLLWGMAGAARFLPAAVAMLVVAVSHLLFPALARRESIKPLAILASQAAQPGERLVFFVNHDHGINFYATGLPLRDTKSELVTLVSPDEIRLLAAGSRSRSLLVLSRRRWVDGLLRADQLRAEALGEHPLGARCSPDCDWVLLRASSR